MLRYLFAYVYGRVIGWMLFAAVIAILWLMNSR